MSSVDQRHFEGHLWTKGVLQNKKYSEDLFFFLEQRPFESIRSWTENVLTSSLGRRPIEGLLWIEYLLKVWTDIHFKVFFGSKTFWRSSMDRRSIKNKKKKPSEGLFCNEDLLKGSMDQILFKSSRGPKTFRRASMTLSSLKVLLWTNIRLKVFFGPKPFLRTYMNWRTFNRTRAFWRFSCTEVFLLFFHGSKSFSTSYVILRTFECLLWTEDI